MVLDMIGPAQNMVFRKSGAVSTEKKERKKRWGSVIFWSTKVGHCN